VPKLILGCYVELEGPKDAILLEDERGVVQAQLTEGTPDARVRRKKGRLSIDDIDGGI